MDPNATLNDAKELIAAGEYAEARYLLAEYRAWRERGGFEPPRGDARHRELARELSALSSHEFGMPVRKPARAPSERFTAKQLSELRRAYSSIDTVDPLSPTFDKLRERLDGMTQEQLKQIAGARIKFLSALARNRIKKNPARRRLSPDEARKLFDKAAGALPMLYKGYWIKGNAITGDLWIEKGRHAITSPSPTMTISRAKETIDELTSLFEGSSENPKGRKMKRKNLSRKAYVGRASQITKRPPTKRLRKRRATMALMRERGFEGAFPNPDSHDLWVQIQRSGKWHDVDGYGSEPAARAVAEIFGKAGYTARVVRK